MSSTLTQSIEEPNAYSRGRVASDHFMSASEVVRGALRLMIERKDGILRGRSSLERPEPSRVPAEPAT